MASSLMLAAAEGNLQKVQDLLNEATVADIEFKGMFNRRPDLRRAQQASVNTTDAANFRPLDQNGVTALIEAVRNGHVDVVRTLLDKG